MHDMEPVAALLSQGWEALTSKQMPDFTSSGCPLCSCQRSNPSPVTCFIGQGQRSGLGWLLAAGLRWPATVFLSAFKNYYHRWDVNGCHQKSFNQGEIVEWAALCWDLRVWQFLFFPPKKAWLQKISHQEAMYQTSQIDQINFATR